MKDKIEKLIIDWLKSDNENTTYIADKICVLLANDPDFSDIELEEKANDQMFVSEDDLTDSQIYREGFFDGAVWVRNKLNPT